MDPSKQVEQAARTMLRAQRTAKQKPRDAVDGVVKGFEAQKTAAEADKMMAPPESVVRAGNEVIRAPEPDEKFSEARDAILYAFENPSMLTVAASEQRVNAAVAVGVLPAAMDAALAAKSTNSLETMLAHQMAAVHHMAMRLLAKASEHGFPPVELVRLRTPAHA